MAQIKIRTGVSSHIVENSSEKELEKIKNEAIITHLISEVCGLFSRGHFEVMERFLDGKDSSGGIEYYFDFIILNFEECKELEEKLKTKKR